MYVQPVNWMAAEILLFPVIWGIVSGVVLTKRKAERVTNSVLLIAALYIIFQYTVMNRIEDNRSSFLIVPFQLVREAVFQNREIFRSLLLNVMLFEPFGATLVNLVPQRAAIWKRILVVCVTGMALSACVEACQYSHRLGNAEADDVICNTLGSFIGALSLPIQNICNRFRYSDQVVGE